jgi:hypothetical protein
MKGSKMFTTGFSILCVVLLVIGIVIFNMYTTKKRENFVESEILEPKKAVESRKIAIVSMMKSPKNLETWLRIHRAIGIARFYIRLEDTPDAEAFLQSQSDVYLQIGESTGINEYKEIQTRQNTWVNEALRLGQVDGMSWLIHIDSDEIVEGDLDIVRRLPENTRTFWMQNVEAKYAAIPRTQDNCFTAAQFVNCAEPGASCVSYANGKAGGRCSPDVSAFGPHRFTSSRNRSDDPKLEGIVVQHYESCDFAMYKEKYAGLAVQDQDNDIPFPYYRDSIEAAKTGNDSELERVYAKYRVV